jgi:ferredoxin
MKVIVDVARCVGHARCAAVAPEVYELNDEGFNVMVEKEIDPLLRDSALRGMRACPERVIKVDAAE